MNLYYSNILSEKTLLCEKWDQGYQMHLITVITLFQRSQHRKQFWRKADNKKTVLTSFKTGDNVMTSFKTGDNATGFQMAEDS